MTTLRKLCCILSLLAFAVCYRQPYTHAYLDSPPAEDKTHSPSELPVESAGHLEEAQIEKEVPEKESEKEKLFRQWMKEHESKKKKEGRIPNYREKVKHFHVLPSYAPSLSPKKYVSFKRFGHSKLETPSYESMLKKYRSRMAHARNATRRDIFSGHSFMGSSLIYGPGPASAQIEAGLRDSWEPQRYAAASSDAFSRNENLNHPNHYKHNQRGLGYGSRLQMRPSRNRGAYQDPKQNSYHSPQQSGYRPGKSGRDPGSSGIMGSHRRLAGAAHIGQPSLFATFFQSAVRNLLQPISSSLFGFGKKTAWDSDDFRARGERINIYDVNGKKCLVDSMQILTPVKEKKIKDILNENKDLHEMNQQLDNENQKYKEPGKKIDEMRKKLHRNLLKKFKKSKGAIENPYEFVKHGKKKAKKNLLLNAKLARALASSVADATDLHHKDALLAIQALKGSVSDGLVSPEDAAREVESAMRDQTDEMLRDGMETLKGARDYMYNSTAGTVEGILEGLKRSPNLYGQISKYFPVSDDFGLSYHLGNISHPIALDALRLRSLFNPLGPRKKPSLRGKLGYSVDKMLDAMVRDFSKLGKIFSISPFSSKKDILKITVALPKMLKDLKRDVNFSISLGIPGLVSISSSYLRLLDSLSGRLHMAISGMDDPRGFFEYLPKILFEINGIDVAIGALNAYHNPLSLKWPLNDFLNNLSDAGFGFSGALPGWHYSLSNPLRGLPSLSGHLPHVPNLPHYSGLPHLKWPGKGMGSCVGKCLLRAIGGQNIF